MPDRSRRLRSRIRDCLGITRAGALAAASAALVSEGRAEPVRVNINEVVNDGTLKDYDIDGDGHADVRFDATLVNLALMYPQDCTLVGQTLFGQVIVDPMNTMYVLGHGAGELIGAAGDSSMAGSYLCDGVWGDFCALYSPRYAGFYFGSAKTETYHWAWAQVNVTEGNDIEVIAFGYEDEPLTQIHAGNPPAVPAGPAVPLALGLLAAGAWMMRRRLGPR